MGITETYRAWCFDEACASFGQACETEMESARKVPKGKKTPSDAILNGKAENALRKMLGMKQKFRDVTAGHRKPEESDV